MKLLCNFLFNIILCLFYFNSFAQFKTLKWTFTGEVRIEKPDSMMRMHSIQEVKENKKFRWVSLFNKKDYSKSVIVFSDSIGNLVEKIECPQLENQLIIAFNYVNKDSIFLFPHPSYNFAQIQEVPFFLINDKGETIFQYSYKSKRQPLLNRENIMRKRSKYGFLYSYQNNKLVILNNKLYIPYQKYGTLGVNKERYPIAVEYDFVKQVPQPIPVFYPNKAYKRKHYSRAYQIPYITEGLQGQVVISTAMSDIIHTYDKNKIVNYKSSTSFFQKINYVPKDKDVIDNPIYNRQGRYLELFSDFNKRQYYRFCKLPIDTTLSVFEQNTERYSFMILDSNFAINAEGIIPDTITGFPILLTKKGIAFKGKEDDNFLEFYNIDSLLDSVSTFKEHISIHNYRNYQNKEDLFGLIKKMIPDAYPKEKYKILIMPLSASCLPCAEQVISKIELFKYELQKQNLYIVPIFSSEHESYSLKKKFDNVPNVLIYSKNEHLYYLNSFFNFKLYSIELGKVIEEFHQNASNIDELFNLMFPKVFK